MIAWEPLVTGYTAVDYVETDGTQMVDTGIRPTPTQTLALDFSQLVGDFVPSRDANRKAGLWDRVQGRMLFDTDGNKIRDLKPFEEGPVTSWLSGFDSQDVFLLLYSPKGY